MSKKEAPNRKKYLRTAVLVTIFSIVVGLYILAPREYEMQEKTIYDQAENKTISYTDKVYTNLTHPYYEITISLMGMVSGYILRTWLE